MGNHISELNILDLDRLRSFFIYHLDYIHCVKAHLFERLQEIEESASFHDLKHSIGQTRQAADKQLLALEEIYHLLDTSYSLDDCSGLVEMIDQMFIAIQDTHEASDLRDLSMLFYLRNIQNLEITSYQVLQTLAVKFNNPYISQLLKESYDEACEDSILLQQLNLKSVAV